MGHRLCAVWILLSVAVFGTSAQSKDESSESDIQYAATELKVELIVQTNHDIGGSYKMTLKLTNPGQQLMLAKKDWSILFHHQNKIVTPAGNQELEVVQAEGCLSVLRPKLNSNYNGFNANEFQEIILEVEGLLLYKTEIFPNFAIYARKVAAKNIQSTTDDDLSFVSLAPQNQSLDDGSRLTSIQRMFNWPDTVDQFRVPDSFVIPAPISISRTVATAVDLKNARSWFVSFDGGIKPSFRKIFLETLASKPNMPQIRSTENMKEVRKNMIHIKKVQPNDPKFQAISTDGYNLIVQNDTATMNTAINITAKSETGIFNGFETLFALMGIHTYIPELTIEDDARFQVRSVSLDLTKNFFPFTVLTKFIDALSMYKLNHLILNLADDHAWRLEMKGIGFDELHNFSSKRCVNQNKCLPPVYGAGADGIPSSSGYFTVVEFEKLIKYGFERHVRVIPKINYLGGLRSALQASVLRYEKLQGTNKKEANRLHLSAGGNPQVPKSQSPEESCYTDGVLNPCIPQTETFINVINQYIVTLYKNAGVPLMGIHAGGDDGVNLYQTFKDCKKLKLNTQNLLEKMVVMVQNSNPVVTLVNEEAMIDPSTNDCIKPKAPNGNVLIDQNKLVIIFHKDFPGNPDNWDMTAEEMDYMFGPIEPPPAGDNETAQAAYMPDYLKPYPGKKRGITAPWAKPYTCANAGYMTILNPEGYTNLESAYELDFDERGTHKSNRYFTINLHRMMLLEPYNIHINMDLSDDMQPLLPHRLCNVFDCTNLNADGQLNLIGLQVSIDTTSIRTENALWETAFPRLAMHAEKSWRQAPFENSLKPTDVLTYDNPNITTFRSQALLNEMTNFLNTNGHKEAGRLDAMNVTYRIGSVGAAIEFGISTFRPPPFPVVVKTDFMAPILYREPNNPNSTWDRLFYLAPLTVPPYTMVVQGGYRFTFPFSNQMIEMRQVSSDGRRAGKSTFLSLSMHNLTPKEIPLPLRRNACLSMKEPIDFAKLSFEQWTQVINNIQYVQGEQMRHGQERMQTLFSALVNYTNSQPSIGPIGLQEVFNGIEQLMSQGQPLRGPYEYIFNKDREIISNRERDLITDMDRMHNQFLTQCSKKTSVPNRQASGSANRRPAQRRRV